LTPKGLRLQRMGRKLDALLPIEFPAHLPVDEHELEFGFPDLDPFDFADLGSAPIVKLKPSAKFPDPERLASKLLVGHYRSERVARPREGQLRPIGKLFIQISPDPRHIMPDPQGLLAQSDDQSRYRDLLR